MQSSTEKRVITLALPGPDIANDAQRFLESAQQYRIDSDFMLEAAAEDLKAVKAKYNALEEQRLSVTRPLDEAKEAVMALFRPAKAFLAKAEDILKLAMDGYMQQQERLRAEAEAKAREQARVEQERLAKEAAERERLAREESERLNAEAEKARKAGNATAASELKMQAEFASLSGQQEAQDLVQQASNVAMAVSVPEPTKIAGISGRTTWSAEVIDLAILNEAVAGGRRLVRSAFTGPDRRVARRAPLRCIEADSKVLNEQARSLQNEFAIPGVKAKPKRGIAADAAK